MTADRAFLDTNIVVYAYDTHDSEKQRVAQSLLFDGIADDRVALSAQVLGEFFTVVTRRIPNPLTVDEAHEVVGDLAIAPIQEIDLTLVQRAIDANRRYGISYWDGLIIAAAERIGCGSIYTEDLNDKQTYYDIKVVNPFRM